MFEFCQMILGGAEFGLFGALDNRDFAQLALEREWACAALFTAADGASVIVDSVFSQEPAMRKLGGQLARQSAVLGYKAVGNSGEPVAG